MKKLIFLLILLLTNKISYCQDDDNFSASFMKAGNPSLTDVYFKKIFKDKEIQINTAKLITGNDTLIGYFGQITLINEQKKIYYSAIGTSDSLLNFSLGFKLDKDSLGYLNTEIELGLSKYTTDKINLTVKYNPESKTVLYKWNRDGISKQNKIQIIKGNIEVGGECPDYKIQLLNGIKINIKEIKNKIIVLNWWHTKCGPCIKEMPSLNQLVESFRTRNDIIFLAICDSPEKEMKDFLEKTTFNYQQGISNSYISEQLSQGYPQHIIINKSGKVSFYLIGGGDDTVKNIKTELEKLIK
jgi:thiol-disulfide isomerase/thioredoxin